MREIEASAGGTILTRPGAPRVLFGVTFLGTALIAYSILQLRQGIYDPQSLRIFHRLFIFEDYPSTFVFLGVLLMGLVSPIQRWGMRVALAFGAHPFRVAFAATATLAVCARFGYLSYPVSMDEYAAFFQSKVFAAGRLSGQFPPAQIDWLIPAYFQNVFFVVSHETGGIASAYWPGFALLLTPFMAIGAPWLCNPILGGFTVLALHRLAMDIFRDRVAAGFVILLTLASVAVTINAISFYSMSAHLLLNTVFAMCVLRRQAKWLFLAGLIGGWALVLHNPVPHTLFALPWIVWLAFQKDRFRLIGALIAGYAPLILALGFGWAYFLLSFRSASQVGEIMLTADEPVRSVLYRAWGNLQNIFHWPTWDVLQARLAGVAKLWLWASPGLLPLAIWGGWKRRTQPVFVLLGASALITLMGFLFYPANQGHGWGFRYFHSAWLALPMLGAAALFAKETTMELREFVAGCALTCLIMMSCLRLYQTHDFISAHVAQLPVADHGEVVLQIASPGMGYYVQDLVQNDPFLRTLPIVMITHGTTNDLAMVRKQYPNLVLLKRSYRGSVWGHAEPTDE